MASKNDRKSPKALSFVSSGVASFALIFLDNIGLLDKLIKSGKIHTQQLNSYKKKWIIERALLELESNRLVKKNNSFYTLTSFGIEVVNYLGLIYYIYSGYSGILSNPNRKSKINHPSVIQGSNLLGEKFIDETIFNELTELAENGTICDLGCGDGRRLFKICEAFNLNGLGFELKKSNLKLSKNQTNQSVRIKKANITKLHGTWNDVNILLQVMVMHDLTPDSMCRSAINSFLDHFPNLQFFLYCDIVAPSPLLPTPLPGFDYIHSLLGIKTRTYHETIKMISSTKFKIIKETSIIKMPNTFLWVLTPKGS